MQNFFESQLLLRQKSYSRRVERAQRQVRADFGSAIIIAAETKTDDADDVVTSGLSDDHASRIKRSFSTTNDNK